MFTEDFIDDCIKRAIQNQPILSQSLLDVRGFSTPTMRRLFHSLCSIGGTYLEVGLFCGGTFCSSFNKNTVSIGIENYDQSFGVDTVRKELDTNIATHADRAKEVYVHFEDCFSVDRSKLPNNIDIFFYDGHHSEENQSKALPYFLDNMADRFVFIVDDINWAEVVEGTDKGFEVLKDKIQIEMAWILKGDKLQDDPVWHNGLGIFLINKK